MVKLWTRSNYVCDRCGPVPRWEVQTGLGGMPHRHVVKRRELTWSLSGKETEMLVSEPCGTVTIGNG